MMKNLESKTQEVEAKINALGFTVKDYIGNYGMRVVELIRNGEGTSLRSYYTFMTGNTFVSEARRQKERFEAYSDLLADAERLIREAA